MPGSFKSTPKDFSDADPAKGLLWFSQIDPKISLILIPVEDSKTLSGSVKSTPKDFSDSYPAKGLLWFSQIDPKISLILIPVEDFKTLTGSVKSTLRFSCFLSSQKPSLVQSD